MILKLGRNEPCHCGSGKKFKHCHGRIAATPPPRPASKEEIARLLQRHEAAERIRQNQQGLGRPVVSLKAFDRQIVAVGNTIYHSTNWKTFPDFLVDHVKMVLDPAWCSAEIAKPLAERHPIMQWAEALSSYQKATIKERGKVVSAPMTGVVACFLGMAYNLYLLKHNVELQARLVKRLKDPAQFQGAYYELIVANTLIRAGFDLTLEDETDGESKHCEFSAVSKRTRKRYWVEAKMRGVSGLLGRTDKDGSSDTNPLSRMVPHLNAAFKKPAKDDRLIFIDLNCEPGTIKDGKPEWGERVIKRLEQYEQKELSKDEGAYVFVTNLPFHRMLDESLSNNPLSIAALPFGVGIHDFNRPGNYRLSEAHRLKQKHIDAYDIGEALQKYPQLPSTFDGSLPSEAFHGDKGRVLIGEAYFFDDIDGKGLVATVTSATVVESEKKMYIGTDSGRILSFPMSDEMLADYQANPESYFGKVQPAGNSKVNNILELFEWLMKTHQQLGRDVLLQRLAGVSDVGAMTDDELRAIYCEGLAAAFQESIETKQNPAPVPSSNLKRKVTMADPKSKPKDTNKLKARLPRGLADRAPAEIAATRRMMETIRQVYELYGFEPVETPAFEYTDALGKFLPDQDRPNEGVFSFQDDDEQWLSLRYDLTAPLARYVAENFDTLPKPHRSYRAGYVFRNEKPGPGRFRQFMQFDADTVGSASMAADAEICMMAADTMEALGIPRGSYVVKVNSRKVLDGVMEACRLGGEENAGKRLTVLRAIDKLDRLGTEGVKELLGKGRKDESGDFTKGADLDFAQIESLMQYINWKALAYVHEKAPDGTIQTHIERDVISPNVSIIDALRSTFGQQKEETGPLMTGLDELAEIAKLVAASGYESRIRIDPSVVRGLEYYTGPVYEVELTFPTADDDGKPVRFGSVGGGGRYDGLVSRFRGEPVPATGFSIGVSRLLAALTHLGKVEAKPEPGPVIVTVFDKDRVADYQRMASTLRQAGIRAELYLGSGKFGPQMKYADRRRSPCVVIQGTDEKQKGEVQIKDLILGAELAGLSKERDDYLKKQAEAQFAVPEDRLVDAVREVLARHGVKWG